MVHQMLRVLFRVIVAVKTEHPYLKIRKRLAMLSLKLFTTSYFTEIMISIVCVGKVSSEQLWLIRINCWKDNSFPDRLFSFKKGVRMCYFLKPLNLTQELSQKISYSSELWYGSCFYDVYKGTAKKRRKNRRYRRKPPIFFCHFSLN